MGVYFLDQNRVICMANAWGGDNSDNSTSMHHNNMICIYELVMYIGVKRYMFQRVAKGCTSQKHLDEPAYSLNFIFQIIEFVFNNDKIIIDLNRYVWCRWDRECGCK